MPAPKHKQTFYSVIINGEIHNVTGRKRSPHGYILLCIKTHPNSDVLGYVFEHRVMMEVKLERYLEKDEVVHHKNGVKHDNRLNNLELMTHGEHSSMHNKNRTYSLEMRKKVSQSTKERFKDKTNHPSYKDIDQRVIELIKEGKKPTEIARRLNVTRKTIYNKIEYLGLKEMYENA
ncbi:HNH endonuclease [Piscibacillus sp. B03]|uniref:HNH endonuclease n=1 Tax=Piscibacillus sp. B03 TaxID=3457430 RepID=UPI003FCCC843